jgi:hypothetical protein
MNGTSIAFVHGVAHYPWWTASHCFNIKRSIIMPQPQEPMKPQKEAQKKQGQKQGARQPDQQKDDKQQGQKQQPQKGCS